MKKGHFELWSLRHAAADGIKFKNAFSKRGTWHFPFTQFNVHKYVSNLHFTTANVENGHYVGRFCYLEFLTVFQKVYGDVYFENILRHKIYDNECQKSGIVICAFRVKSLFGLPSIFSVYFVLSHIIYYCKFSPRLISKILLLGFCQNWRLLWQ